MPALLELVEDEILSITTLVAKTRHRVADLFAIPDRSYFREGYWADLVLIKPEPGGFVVSRQQSCINAAGPPSPDSFSVTASAPRSYRGELPGTTNV